MLLVALVPAANFLAFKRVNHSGNRADAWLPYLLPAALAVSLSYTVVFLPMLPMAGIALVFLGLGLLPLTPILAFAANLHALRKAPIFQPRDKRPVVGFTLGFAALALPLAWEMATCALIEKASTARGAGEQASAIQWLRHIGSERTMREVCYRTASDPWTTIMNARLFSNVSDLETNQKVYYRVTGVPYNSKPAPSAVSVTGRSGRGIRNFDQHIGGERVAGKVAGLTMETSQLEGKVDATGLTSYTEWTMVFKNIAGDASEARAQIELPPGGVVSRLTLWIGGEPREAAFGSREQVRAAYREIAVVQRRDPVLVNTCGPDRILMQCFPVPADGGEMKIRIGITAPVRLTAARGGAVDWPRLIETNFASASGLAHHAKIESNVPFIGGSTTALRELRDRAFQEATPLLIALPESASDSATDDPADPASAIRQTVRVEKSARPKKVAWVIDGSREMRPHFKGLIELAAKTEHAPDLVFFAGDAISAWEPKTGPLKDWLQMHECIGGRANVPALTAAWQKLRGESDAGIVWIHGTQPVLLGEINPLIESFASDEPHPRIFDIDIGTGPNRIAEKIDTLVTWHRVLDGWKAADRLALLLDRWAGRANRYVVERERIPRSEITGPAKAADRHVARLWGREEIERMRVTPTQREEAEKLAVQLQLVTPVSGAVVLETQQQYDRHGLKPVDPATVPVVPEPGTVALLLIGAGWLGSRRVRRGH